MKEQYGTPELIEYGNLLEVTHGAGAGSFCDNSSWNNYSG